LIVGSAILVYLDIGFSIIKISLAVSAAAVGYGDCGMAVTWWVILSSLIELMFITYNLAKLPVIR
jgi:hypothetical protein